MHGMCGPRLMRVELIVGLGLKTTCLPHETDDSVGNVIPLDHPRAVGIEWEGA